MPKSRRRKQNGKPGPTAAAAIDHAVLALHDQPDATSESRAVRALVDFARAVQKGHGFAIAPHLDARSEYVLEVTLADGRVLQDSSATWSAVEDDPTALARTADTWRAIARHAVNPALGFRADIGRPAMDRIAGGFGEVGRIAERVRAYVSASIAEDATLSAVGGTVDLLVRFPSASMPAEASLWTSNPYGVSTDVDLDYRPGMEEIASRLLASAPMAYRVDVDEAEESKRLVVSRLEMRHEEIAAASREEVAATRAEPSCEGLSFRILPAGWSQDGAARLHEGTGSRGD